MPRTPHFLYELAPLVVATPPGVPDGDVGRTPVPSTGPYQVGTFYADGSLTLTRNPYYSTWSTAAQPPGYPDVIELRAGHDYDSAFESVKAGAADLAQVPFDRYAVATSRPSQIHAASENNTDAVYLNSRLPPFDDKRVRQALNYALDRRALVALYHGGDAAASVSCQLLPPGFPGYRPYCPYQSGPADGPYLGPDLDKARALVQASGTTSIPVTVHSLADPLYQPFAEYVAAVLRGLGYAVTVQPFPRGIGEPAGPAFDAFQLFTQDGWLPDYPSPSTFYDWAATCKAMNPNRFCDPQVDALAQTALALEETDLNAALRQWAEVDRRLTDDAAFVTIGNHNRLDIAADRVGNVQEGSFGPALSQVWVR